MPEIEFTVSCEMPSHGELETVWSERGENVLLVVPCEKCIDEAREQGNKDR